jgi:serine/threonine protein kinase
MDLAEGNVLSQYYKGLALKRMGESESAMIFKQIVEGMSYCHRLGIYHRDLKTENIMIDKYRRIKIIDFGFSVKSNATTKLTLFCGTPNYMSPEIILKREYIGAPSDCWALGVLLFVINAGFFPFKGSREITPGKNDKELHKKIIDIALVFPDHFSESLKSLITSILQFSPGTRLTSDQILEHTWFREAK